MNLEVLRCATCGCADPVQVHTDDWNDGPNYRCADCKHTTAPVLARLDVVGLPAPQGSKSRMPNGAIVEGKSANQRAAVAAWRSAVADAARAWVLERNAEPFDGPLDVEIEFRFPLPKSDPYRTRHTTQPDLDKITRATFDALKIGGLIKDDALIWSLAATKVYARSTHVGAVIVVSSDAKSEANRREFLKAAARDAKKAG